MNSRVRQPPHRAYPPSSARLAPSGVATYPERGELPQSAEPTVVFSGIMAYDPNIQMAKCVTRLFRDDQERKRLGRIGYEAARAMNWDRTAAQLSRLLRAAD